jgi:hypothetical protein
VDADRLAALELALEEEGLFSTRDDDDEALRVAFKSEGDRYFIVSYRDDPNFVMIGSGWSLPEGAERERVMRIINALNARKKFVKSALWEEENDVLFTIELCVVTPEEIRPHFGRLLDVLRDSASEFFAELRAG